MLCTKCRIKFKKYGSETHLDIDLDNQTPSDVRNLSNQKNQIFVILAVLRQSM